LLRCLQKTTIRWQQFSAGGNAMAPTTQIATGVALADDADKIYELEDEMVSETLLPGFRLPINELFQQPVHV
jgi:hypothetical protein